MYKTGAGLVLASLSLFLSALPGTFSCPAISGIPDPRTEQLSCHNSDDDYVGGLACRIASNISSADVGSRPTTADILEISDYLKEVTGKTKCQCNKKSQCTKAAGLGEGFAFLVLFVEGSQCGETSLKALGKELMQDQWSGYKGCNDWILMLFSKASYWVELGSLANDFIETHKRDKVANGLAALVRQNTDAQGDTDYLPVVKSIVDDLMPDLKTEFDGWVWIIIGICGALVLLLLVLATIGVVCYMKSSGVGKSSSRGRKKKTAQLDTSPLTSSSGRYGGQMAQYDSDSD